MYTYILLLLMVNTESLYIINGEEKKEKKLFFNFMARLLPLNVKLQNLVLLFKNNLCPSIAYLEVIRSLMSLNICNSKTD